MQTWRRRSLIGLAPLLVSVWAGAETSLPDVQIVARAFVPNRAIPQGEVRLVREGDRTVVQTVLRTRFVDKVKDRIAKNERGSWGDHPDAVAYLDLLETACAEYKKRKADGGEEAALVIDFVDGPTGSSVEFSFPPVSRNRDGLHIGSADPWRSLEAGQEYVRRNQELILVDSLKADAADLQERLRAYRTPSGGPKDE